MSLACSLHEMTSSSVSESKQRELKNTKMENFKNYRAPKERVAKGFYVTRDCPKISCVMRDCAQLICVMHDKIVQCDT